MKTSVVFLYVCFLISIGFSNPQFKKVAYCPIWNPLEDVMDVSFEPFTHINIEAIYAHEDGTLNIKEKHREIIDTIISKGRNSGSLLYITVGYDATTMKMIEDETARARFVQELTAYCHRHNLHGVDLDFEGSFDKDAYTELARELRSSLPDTVGITAAVNANPNYNGGLWSNEFLDICDWINIMIYDIRGSWQNSPIGNHSTFEDFKRCSGDWLRKLPADKLVLGSPLYGRTFADGGGMRIWGEVPWASNGLTYDQIRRYFPDHLITDSTAGDFGLTLNDLGLSEEELEQFNIEVNWDRFNEKPLSGDEMLGKTYYSGPEISHQKAKWARENNFAGIMLCKLTQDDKNGSITKALTDYSTSSISKVSNNGKSNYGIKIQNNSISINNPTGDEITFSLFDLKGRELFQTVSTETDISLPHIASGIYLLNVKNNVSNRVHQMVIGR